MPEPVALSKRGILVDDYSVKLPIVEYDGLKLPNCLTPSYPALQRIENIFKPVSVGRCDDLSPLRSGCPHREPSASATLDAAMEVN
jgi:hypothetical protein